MKSQTDKIFFYRFFTSRLFFFVVGGFLILFGLGFARSYYHAYKIQQEINSLHEDVDTLKQKKLESLDLLSYVLSQNFVEEKARTELNFKKDGEHVLVIPSTQTPETAPVSARPTTRQPVPNPVKWWYYFSHQGAKD